MKSLPRSMALTVPQHIQFQSRNHLILHVAFASLRQHVLVGVYGAVFVLDQGKHGTGCDVLRATTEGQLGWVGRWVSTRESNRVFPTGIFSMRQQPLRERDSV